VHVSFVLRAAYVRPDNNVAWAAATAVKRVPSSPEDVLSLSVR